MFWEPSCKGKHIIPAFPGTGSGFEDGILKARLIPKIIQTTTLAEIDGKRTDRLKRLSDIFKNGKDGIFFAICFRRFGEV